MKTILILLACSLILSTRSSAQENPMGAKYDRAIFAGGCFWCMEAPFLKLPGVVRVLPGYCGGREKNPTYEQVSMGVTGHAEAVEIVYDPSKTTYQELLDVFWRQIDPTTVNQQFADHGPQYRTAIFYLGDEQKRIAEASKADMSASGRYDQPIVTEISPATDFWPAEDYHQEYYKKNPMRYKLYRQGSGRDRYLEKIWGKDQEH